MSGKKTHDTVIGALVSIGIITTILMYSVQLAIQKNDLSKSPVILESHKFNYYDTNDTINRRVDGLNFAVAVIDVL